MTQKMPRRSFAMDTRQFYDLDQGAETMTAMSTEERRNAPNPDGLAQLIEVGRPTKTIENQYDRARAEFIAAGQALDQQRQRYLKRAEQLPAGFDVSGYAECREPRPPLPVSADELAWKE